MPLGPFISNTARKRRRRWPWVLGVLVALAVAGGAAYLILGQKPEDVSNRDVEFKAPQEQTSGSAIFSWPFYGRTAARTRYLNRELQYPLKPSWKRGGSKLIEFQPVLAKRTLFFVKNNGEAYALSAPNGNIRWHRRIARLNASSPAWWRNRIFIATLDPGQIISLEARTGRILWRKRLPSRSESSPVVVGRNLFFGTENGTVYALDARTGRGRWTYKAGGAVKAALAYEDGRLYFGDYGDHFQAISVRSGRRIWRTGGLGQELGRGGRFYATAAVAFGRVYVGNYDGRIYSFSARSGKIAWTRDTGNYVLAAPAVAAVPGTRPSVYIGSTTGDFFALDARTGDTRWKKAFGGRILGPATVVDDVVYFSNVDKKSTTGLRASDGKRVFAFGRGGYNPVISDGRRLFLTGYSSVYGFDGREVRSAQRKAKRKSPRSKQR